MRRVLPVAAEHRMHGERQAEDRVRTIPAAKPTVGRRAPRSDKIPNFNLTTTFLFARPASTQARASLVDENGNIRSITERMSQRTQFGRRGRRTVLVATGCHGAADAFAFGFRQGVEGF